MENLLIDSVHSQVEQTHVGYACKLQQEKLVLTPEVKRTSWLSKKRECANQEWGILVFFLNKQNMLQEKELFMLFKSNFMRRKKIILSTQQFTS